MSKTYYHECEICGASLDPGEGSICDDCKAEQEAQENTDNEKTEVSDSSVSKE